MMRFSFENALFHFARARGTRNFLIRYIPSHVGVSLLLIVLIVFMVLGAAAIDPFNGATFAPGAINDNPEEMSDAMLAVTLVLIFPIAIYVFAVLEASYQRHYVRGERFYLRLGADEWRVFVVFLCWFLLFFLSLFFISLVLGFVLALFGLLFADPVVAGMMAGYLSTLLSIFIVLPIIAVRFCPASAMTIRDRRIRFLSAWATTKGKFWSLLGVYLVTLALWIAAIFVFGIIAFAFLMIFVGLGSAGTDLSSRDVEPNMVVVAITIFLIFLYYLISFAARAFFYYVWAGPAALVAMSELPSSETEMADSLPPEIG